MAAAAPVDVLSTANSISVSQRERNGLRGNQNFARVRTPGWREEGGRPAGDKAISVALSRAVR
ncbi:hypothetical protein IE996_27185 [Klebsiella pneumoniae]|uniref:Uncharacterized protein n=1 Tax=Klebsiella pneumoniae TaxID=573 RepID=A0A927DNE6_KLEPN|nr:hypothetical protein [Klebsiella pneumoniae]